MPQPIKSTGGGAVSSGHHVITERPECAIGIAYICNCWATLEGALAGLAGSIAGTHEDHGAAGVIGSSTNQAAIEAVYALDSLNARREVIQAICGEFLDKEQADELNALLLSVRKLARARNDAVHTGWSIWDRFPNDVIKEDRRTGDRVRYTPADFNAIAERIRWKCVEIGNFQQNCIRRAVGLEPISEWPALRIEPRGPISYDDSPTQQEKLPPEDSGPQPQS